MATIAPPHPRASRVLQTYRHPGGERRELIAREGAGGSLLVIDRSSVGARKELLLAHLGADEPHESAAAVCSEYLASDPRRRRCRAVERADELALPFEPRPHVRTVACTSEAVVNDGCIYVLRPRPANMRIPQLRWVRRSESSGAGDLTVSLREAIGAAESYEPFCSITREALARWDGDAALSTIALRSELERVESSAIVLNRALREAVVREVKSGNASMSAIAIRCGRVKRDNRGNVSGETSWLARRVGLLAEGGRGATTPWVHSQVLGLIARRGLGLSPREVELG